MPGAERVLEEIKDFRKLVLPKWLSVRENGDSEEKGAGNEEEEEASKNSFLGGKVSRRWFPREKIRCSCRGREGGSDGVVLVVGAERVLEEIKDFRKLVLPKWLSVIRQL